MVIGALVGALAIGPAIAQSTPEKAVHLPLGKPLSLGQALKITLDNDDVAIARAAAEAAKADVHAADRRPFPTLSAKLGSIDLENGTGSGNWLTERRIDKGVGIDWVWERGNKRALRTQVAQAAAAAAVSDVRDVQIQQLLVASGAFFDLASAQERVAQLEELAAVARQSAEAAAKRVSAGDLARQDALRLEIEAGRARSDAAAAVLDRRRAATNLAQVMDVDAPDVPRWVQAHWVQAAEAPSDWTQLESRVGALVESRPDVRAAADRLASARSAVDAARSQNKADLTWGVSLDHFPGNSSSLLELRLQMPLQIGYAFQGEIGKAMAQADAAESALNRVRLSSALEYKRMLAELHGARIKSQGHEQDILPRARQVAAQAELGYNRGGLSLNDLLDARRTVRAAQLEALAAKTDLAKAAIAWRLRTGPIEPLLNE